MSEIIRETIVYALVQNDQILMARRLKESDVYFDQFIIPGGKVDDLDKKFSDYLEAALLRETQEELGVTPTEYTYLFSNSYSILPEVLLHFFIVTKWSGDITNREPEKESFEWHGLEEVLSVTKFTSVQQAINAILNHTANTRRTLLGIENETR